MPDMETPALRLVSAGAGIVTEHQQVLDSRPTKTAQAVPRFGVGANIATDLQHRANRIRYCIRASVINVGRDLIEAKRHQLKHGQFIAWIETECGLNRRTAQRITQAAAWAEGESDTVSLLTPAVIYALSAPSTPVEIHDALLGRIEAGERVEPDEVKTKIAEARRKAKAAARRARMSPEQWARAERREARRCNRLQEERREREERQARQERVLDELADLLINQIADQEQLPALIEEIQHSGIYLLRRRILAMGSP